MMMMLVMSNNSEHDGDARDAGDDDDDDDYPDVISINLDSPPATSPLAVNQSMLTPPIL